MQHKKFQKNTPLKKNYQMPKTYCKKIQTKNNKKTYKIQKTLNKIIKYFLDQTTKKK